MQRKKRRTLKSGFKFSLPHINMQWPALNNKVWALLALTLFLLFLRFIILPGKDKKTAQPRMSGAAATRVSTTVRDVLAQFDITQERLAPVDSLTRVTIPQDFSFFAFYGELRQALAATGADILDCQKTANGTFMSVGKGKAVAEYLLFVTSRRVQTARGHAAIIIDDFGYSFDKLTRSFLTMRLPITISVIPGLANSQKVAEIADVHGKEVLVHMPMEPEREKYVDDGFTLITGQDPGKVSLRLRQAFAQIPMAAGLNNHQGSKATADAALMNTVMQSMKGLDKYFIDSQTSPNSIAYETAKEYGIKAGRNQLFLDVQDDKTFIRNQLNRMTELAKERGDVIAIGHVRKKTFAVLEEMAATLAASGVTFVYASQVVN